MAALWPRVSKTTPRGGCTAQGDLGLLGGEEVQLVALPPSCLHAQAFRVVCILCRKQRNPDRLANHNVSLEKAFRRFHNVHCLNYPLRP